MRSITVRVDGEKHKETYDRFIKICEDRDLNRSAVIHKLIYLFVEEKCLEDELMARLKKELK